MMNEQFSAVTDAMNNFLLLSILVSKKSYTRTLPKSVAATIAQRIATTKDGETSPALNIVPMFGASGQAQYNAKILKLLGQFRNNFIYKLPEIGGERAITVAEMPNIYPQLEAERDRIVEAIAEAADENFERWVETGRRSAIRVYSDVFPGVADWLEYPTKSEFTQSNYIRIGTPHRMAEDLKNVNLPADLLRRFEQEHADRAQKQLEQAREKVIAATRKHLDVVARQLGPNGERLSSGLAENLAASAATLRTFTENYDNDLRIISIIDAIEAKISMVGRSSDNTVERWKHFPNHREDTRQAAVTDSRQLGDLEKRDLPSLLANADDEYAGGGILGDLL